MPLKHGKPTRSLVSLLDAIEDVDQRERLAEAIRMDNRGPWFLCRSHWTVAQLERRFAEELVGGVLYERVGGMLQGDKPYVYLQIALMRTTFQRLHPDSEPEQIEVPTEGPWPDYNVIEALKELRVTVVSIVPEIRDVIEAGGY
jgi:hypothetical protein